jgi:hypothetical protein
MKNMILKNKRIFIILQRDWAVRHGFEIAKKLNENGAEISTLIFKKSTEGYIKIQNDVKFKYIINESEIENNYKQIVKESNYKIENLLTDFEINSIWEAAFTLRQKSLSYKKKYPFAYEQCVNDKEIQDYILAYAYKIKNLIEEFKPELIVAYNFGDIRHLLLNKIANKNKIPMFCMSDTKVQHTHTFFYDINMSKSFFHKRLNDLNNKKIKSQNIQKAKIYIEESRKRLKLPLHVQSLSLNKSIFDKLYFIKLIKNILRNLKLNTKQLKESETKKIKYFLRDFVQQKINIYQLKNFEYDKLENIDSFVFFPLQHYPEAQLGLLNAVNDNQLNAAKIIARFLPKNLTLVIKNHPFNYEWRSKAFLTKFKNTPNIKVIDHKISNFEVYKRMDYLISPGGTAIFEAALEKKPAIQFGSLEIMKDLPNFYVLKNLEDIGKLILTIDKNFHKLKSSNEYEEKLINYVCSAYDTGHDSLIYESDLRNNTENLEYLWNVYLKEIKKIFKYYEKFTF